MKKLIFGMCVIGLTFLSCTKEDQIKQNDLPNSQRTELEVQKDMVLHAETYAATVDSTAGELTGKVNCIQRTTLNGVNYYHACITVKKRTYFLEYAYSASGDLIHTQCNAQIGCSCNDSWKQSQTSKIGDTLTSDDPEYANIIETVKGGIESGILETGKEYSCDTCRCRMTSAHMPHGATVSVYCTVVCTHHTYLVHYNLLTHEASFPTIID